MLCLFGCGPSSNSLGKLKVAKDYSAVVYAIGYPNRSHITKNGTNIKIESEWCFNNGQSIVCISVNNKITELRLENLSFPEAEQSND